VTGARSATTSRTTRETTVEVTLDLDGTGVSEVSTGLPFFDHLVSQLGRHGGFDLRVTATGDLEVDGHHTVEDVGIVLGQAFRQALGDKQGIRRFGEATIPMDETLVQGVVDFGGRAAFIYRADSLKGRWVGDFDCELAREFFGGFVSTAHCNLHLEVRYGENAHHIVEALFKAFARASRAAVALDPREGGVPSTKGTLTT
jgi:imidazoleglycerol-phosphate dehydratase